MILTIDLPKQWSRGIPTHVPEGILAGAGAISDSHSCPDFFQLCTIYAALTAPAIKDVLSIYSTQARQVLLPAQNWLLYDIKGSREH